MYKISPNREYFVDPFSNLKIIFKNKYQSAVTGDLIMVFGTGYTCVDARVILSPLIRTLYAL
jgi:hypothetical protein